MGVGGRGVISVTQKLRHTSIDAIYTDVSNSLSHLRYTKVMNSSGRGKMTEKFGDVICSNRILTNGTSDNLIFLTAACNIFLSVTALLGNMVILTALRKETSLHPPTRLLLRNLATTDFFGWAFFRAAGRRLFAVRYPSRLVLVPGRRDHHVYCGLHVGACVLMDCDCYKFWPSPRFKIGHPALGGCDYQENVCGYNNILGDVHCTFVIVCHREPCIVLVQPSHCSIMLGDFYSVVRGDFPMAASAANSRNIRQLAATATRWNNYVEDSTIQKDSQQYSLGEAVVDYMLFALRCGFSSVLFQSVFVTFSPLANDNECCICELYVESLPLLLEDQRGEKSCEEYIQAIIMLVINLEWSLPWLNRLILDFGFSGRYDRLKRGVKTFSQAWKKEQILCPIHTKAYMF